MDTQFVNILQKNVQFPLSVIEVGLHTKNQQEKVNEAYMLVNKYVLCLVDLDLVWQ